MFGKETKKERIRRMELEYQLNLEHQAALDSAINRTVDAVAPALMNILQSLVFGPTVPTQVVQETTTAKEQTTKDA